MKKIIYFLYKHLINIVNKILTVLNSLIPKKDRILFYNSEMIDNSKYLFDFLTMTNEFEIICYTDEKINQEEKCSSNKLKYINNNLSLIYYFITSRFIIYSFMMRFKIKPKSNQIIIQLWHGSPLKEIGNDRTNLNYHKQRARYFTYIILSSKFFIDTYKKAFGCLDNQIKILGNPRNDSLFNPYSKEKINTFFGYKYNKTILWMPTYRKSRKLHNIEDSSVDIPILNKDNINSINTFLKSKNILLIIKPHPLQNSIKNLASELSHLKIIDNYDLIKLQIDLYRILGSVDALITDYSSVYFDYLLIDRPIGFVIDDIIEYKNNRGFITKEPEKMMPGPKIKTIDQLYQFIDDISKNFDSYSIERQKICDLTNYYQDDGNCMRMYKLISKLMSE